MEFFELFFIGFEYIEIKLCLFAQKKLVELHGKPEYGQYSKSKANSLIKIGIGVTGNIIIEYYYICSQFISQFITVI